MKKGNKVNRTAKAVMLEVVSGKKLSTLLEERKDMTKQEIAFDLTEMIRLKFPGETVSASNVYFWMKELSKGGK